MKSTNMSFKRINQPDAAISQVPYLSFNAAQHVSGILMPITRSSTTAVAASGLPSELDDSSADWPDHNQQHCYHQALTVNQRLLLQLLNSW
jgi:hypothetical protein